MLLVENSTITEKNYTFEYLDGTEYAWMSSMIFTHIHHSDMKKWIQIRAELLISS